MGYRPVPELPILEVRESYLESRERSLRRHNEHVIARQRRLINSPRQLVAGFIITVLVVSFLLALKAVGF